MEALLDVRVAIHEVAVGLDDHVKLIVEPIVSNIVAEGGHDERKRIDVVKHRELSHILRLQNKMAVLCHVRSMQVIMILH